MVRNPKLLSLIVVALLAVSAFADRPPKPGTFYKDSELGIRKKELKGTKLHITFSPKHEQFYWCPGIQVEHTPKATVVTFMRAKTSKNGRVDQKAKYDKKMITQQVVFDTKKRETYIRNGEKSFKKIYSPKQQKGSTTKTKNVSVKKPGSKTEKTKANTPAALPTAKPIGQLQPSRADLKKSKMLLNNYVLPSTE